MSKTSCLIDKLLFHSNVIDVENVLWLQRKIQTDIVQHSTLINCAVVKMINLCPKDTQINNQLGCMNWYIELKTTSNQNYLCSSTGRKVISCNSGLPQQIGVDCSEFCDKQQKQNGIPT